MPHKNNVDLICSVAELEGIFTGTRSLGDFLQQVVDTVGHHMNASVCSIYLYDENHRELVLRATRGLRPDAVGKVRMKLGEGISGRALKELRPINAPHGSHNPSFKFFPGIEEERFEALLAVPITRALQRVGVIVVQHVNAGYFDENDTKALRAIASQLAVAIENAKLLLNLHELTGDNERTEAEAVAELPVHGILVGRPGSDGIAIGRALHHGPLARPNDEDNKGGEACDATLEDFDQALAVTEKQLEELQDRLEREMADVAASMIFSVHLLMLKDEAFSGDIRKRIVAGTNPAVAIADVVDQFSNLFKQNQNPRLREKVQDIQDLGYRLRRNLTPDASSTDDFSSCIVIGREVLPSDLLKLVAQRVAGLVLTEGSFTAHVAILARALAIPMVMVNDPRLHQLPENTELLLDAHQGTVYVNPDETVKEQFEHAQEIARNLDASPPVKPETRTADGVRVELLANINLLSELRVARGLNADGIGLYRSEFPYIVRNDFPSEEEQVRIYRQIGDEMDENEVTYRTLDIGGDKMLSYFPSVNEENPFLGLRAIRFSLRHRNVFKDQLRALLRAGVGRNLRIMFPLVSSVDDFQSATAIIAECAQELRAEDVPHNEAPQLGVMVELPSAVEVVEELAAEAAFLCIGSNDLVQYMLAVDRTNQAIADYYVPYHPAVLRALARIAEAARRHGVDVSICGEMAAEKRLLSFLIGIGIRKFSMDARRIPDVQAAMATIDSNAAADNARQLLTLGRICDVEKYLTAHATN